MRVLALDYGSARCGCAVSDPTGTIVTPVETVARPATRRGLAQLRELAAARDAELVLVGLPLGLDGRDTAQTIETRRFAERLQRALGEIPVELHDERFTTKLAQRTRSQAGPSSAGEDAHAAAHLLAGWLDSRAR